MQRVHPSKALGCAPSEFRGELGPPAPRVRARLIGRHVEVVATFAHMPHALACRPWTLTAVVDGTARGAGSPTPSVQTFRVVGDHGRAVVVLPLYAAPPYRLLVEAATLSGRRSRYIRLPLPCPRTGERRRGCLRGERPVDPRAGRPLDRQPLPKPVLPLRGVDRATLEATVRYVLAPERKPPFLYAAPRRSRCPTVRTCEVTYVDPAFPGRPYRVTYRIAGEQARGCWIGRRARIRDQLPFPDAYTGQRDLAACVSWLR